MSTPEQPADPSPAAPPILPAPPAVTPRETIGERVGDFFHREAPALKAVAHDAEALARGHSAALMRLGADLLENHPGAEPVASRVLEVALGVAKAAGIAL